MPRETSQTLKDKCYMIPLIYTKKGKFRETEGRTEFTRGWKEGGDRELLFNGYGISVWDDENFLELDGGDGQATT